LIRGRRIIFMVTAKLVVSRALPMDLPSAAAGGELQSVSLGVDGSMKVDGAPAPDDATLFCSSLATRAPKPPSCRRWCRPTARCGTGA
jgi:hypothetical protein